MSEASIESDKEVGVALALGAIAVVGAIVLFGHPSQIGKAWGSERRSSSPSVRSSPSRSSTECDPDEKPLRTFDAYFRT